MARTISAAQRSAIAALRSGHFSRFRVQDADGVFRDYTQYLRTDWFTGATIRDSIDQSTPTLNATLLRQAGTLSLSPFVAASLVNRNGAGAYATSIDLWRKWAVDVSVRPEGYPPTGTDWIELCAGRIDVIEWSGDLINVTGRGEDAVILDYWIATERQYGSGGGTAMETVIQSMSDNNLNAISPTLFTPVSPGYNMLPWTQPKGNLGPAISTVASKAGDVTRYRYDASDVNRYTLFAPNRSAAPGSEVWTLGPSEYTNVQKVAIDKQGIRNFIKLRFAHPTLGVQTVIYPHMAGTGTVTCAAGAATFSSSQAGILQNGAEIIVAGIPYTVTAFSGTTTATLLSQLATGGTPTFGASAFTAHDTLSGAGMIQPIGGQRARVDMEIDLSYDTQVTDPTKAQGMSDNVGSDNELPALEQTIELLGAWFIQLYDYGKFLANGIHYDSDQYAAVTSIQHDIANGTIKTTIGVRGKPAGAYATWKALARSTVPSGPPSSQNRDTKPVQLRLTRVSETADQVVIRAEAITPNVGAPVSVAYSGGGLTVSPASPVALAATTDWTTTPHQDFTITRDTQGGTPRRVAFTGASSGYVDGTDGVDVPPNSNRLNCTLRRTAGSTLISATPLKIPWDVEDVDNGGFHDNVTNPSRITWPMTGIVALTVQADFNGNATAGLRTIAVLDQVAATVADAALGTAGNRWTASITKIFAVTAGNYVEVSVTQVSGVNETLTGGNQTTKIDIIYLF